ncbi:DUF4190 domain-containing protein [Eubacterium sp.]|uniref:DUF4190 domain-containing protein n=1 Tax=Eubacterium sp. TaxID=142586 RepID=UPI0015AB3920|nr:DUF4190 domain-containing protein [uncultured Eubacterium sp.]
MENSNRAVASLILGLVSIVTWLFPIAGYITTILAIVFATKGRHSEKKGMATAGLVLGIIFLVVTLLNSILGAVLGVLANL